MLSKSKNIAKRWEGCSKSHFSHIRNKVEKVILRPLILERFLEPKSTQDREKVLSESLQKSSRFYIRFFIDFGSILDPTGHPKIEYFWLNFALGVALGPSWRQEGAQSAPGQLQRSIFLEFGTILGSILEDFSMIFGYIFIQLPGWSHIRWYLFYNITVANFQLAALIFSLGTVAAWRAQRTGYIVYITRWIGASCLYILHCLRSAECLWLLRSRPTPMH